MGMSQLCGAELVPAGAASWCRDTAADGDPGRLHNAWPPSASAVHATGIPIVGVWCRSFAACSHPDGAEPACAVKPGPGAWQLPMPAKPTKPVLPAPHNVGTEGSTAAGQAGSGVLGFAGRHPVSRVLARLGAPAGLIRALTALAPDSARSWRTKRRPAHKREACFCVWCCLQLPGAQGWGGGKAAMVGMGWGCSLPCLGGASVGGEP